ncbi:MAG: helix-turn-helix transcriptional regulator [Thermomicrobiales bacterium]
MAMAGEGNASSQGEHEDDKGFSRWLTGLLRAQNIKASELARRLGVQRSQVSKWTTGRSVPDSLSCRLIADALDIDAAEVLFAAGHLDAPAVESGDPIRDRLHELVARIPSAELAPFLPIFERMAGERS